MHVDRDIFKNAQDAIMITDASGKVSEINPSALKLIKKRQEKIIGQKLDQFFDGDFNKKKGEVELRKQNITLQYTRSEASNKQGFLYFFRDITDLKEEMMRREHFLGIAGHELKNPLATIKALNHVLLSQKAVRENELLTEYVKKINNKTDTLTKLIVELLDITKIKQKTLQLNPEVVSFNSLLSEVCEDFGHVNTTHEVIINNKTDENMFIDKSRIEQVIINLLKNAAKYSPDQNKIFINVKKTKKYLVCEVIDFGVGIPADQIDKVFNLYYRIPGRERTFDGLGVGLFIAYQIVRAHGGKMKIKSQLDHGSQLIFSLPFKPVFKNA